MPRALKKIADPQNDLRLFNENFDNISLDMADARGVFSTTFSATIGPLAPGEGAAIDLNILDTRSITQQGKLPVVFRWTVFVDNDDDSNSVWPVGANITKYMLGSINIIGWQQSFLINPSEFEKASVAMTISNAHFDNHTFYVYGNAFYVPGPELGVALRST